MNWARSVIFLLLFVAGLGYLLWVEFPESERKEREEFVFRNAAKDDFARIAIKRAGEEFYLEKLDASRAAASPSPAPAATPAATPTPQWGFSGIEGAEADAMALNSLLSALKDLKSGEAIPPEEVDADPKVYGLDAPEVALDVSLRSGDGKGEEVHLAFGKKNEYVNQRYVQVQRKGAPRALLYLVPEIPFTAANKPKLDFRARTLISFSDSDIVSANVTLPGASYEVVRTDPPNSAEDPRSFSRWALGGPPGFRIADSSFMDVVRAIRGLRVGQFFDGDEAKDKTVFGLENPDVTVRLQLRPEANREPLEVRVRAIKNGGDAVQGKTSGAFFSLSSKPSVFHVESDPVPSIAKTPEAIRELQLFRFSQDQVSKLEIMPVGGSAISMVRERGVPPTPSGASSPALPASFAPWQDWMIEGKRGDQVFIRQYLTDLSGLKANGFPAQGTDPGMSSPHGSVTLFFEGDKKLRLVMGADSGSDSSGKPQGRFAAIFVGSADTPADTMIVAGADVEKIFPRLEVLLPAQGPTPTPEG